MKIEVVNEEDIDCWAKLDKISDALLNRACREVDSLIFACDVNRDSLMQKLGYVDQIILVLDDMSEIIDNKYLYDAERYLKMLYRSVADGINNDTVEYFIDRFLHWKRHSVVFPNKEIIINAIDDTNKKFGGD